MSNLKERLQQIKDDYARHDDFIDWDDFMSHSYTNKHTVNLSIDEICKRYAEEVIKEASEVAETKSEIKTHKADGIRRSGGSWREISIDKQSILKLIEEL